MSVCAHSTPALAVELTPIRRRASLRPHRQPVELQPAQQRRVGRLVERRELFVVLAVGREPCGAQGGRGRRRGGAAQRGRAGARRGAGASSQRRALRCEVPCRLGPLETDVCTCRRAASVRTPARRPASPSAPRSTCTRVASPSRTSTRSRPRRPSRRTSRRMSRPRRRPARPRSSGRSAARGRPRCSCLRGGTARRRGRGG